MAVGFRCSNLVLLAYVAYVAGAYDTRKQDFRFVEFVKKGKDKDMKDVRRGITIGWGVSFNVI